MEEQTGLCSLCTHDYCRVKLDDCTMMEREVKTNLKCF